MHLFIYGTLRFPDSLIKQGPLMIEFEFVGKGKMKAVMYDIGNYPGAVKDDSGNEVLGDLYRILDEEMVLDILDRYENYNKENERSCEYVRRKTRIRTNAGEFRMAWVYWYNGDISSKQRIEERDYLDYLKKKIGGFKRD